MGEGGVYSSITVYLSVWDRLRVLFGARMVVYLDTRVEKDPGRLVSEESRVVIGVPAGASSQGVVSTYAASRVDVHGTAP